uniref:Uncharacterized protein AlNc14C32G2942 n=1 Tax=Albugo laibachii Nc14 TaxID=890382 RepID=F0W7Z2_9STRA|nr:conserved hypothetical protein [Albugo laibachii Nc14]|eukprot:CCA17245.1 conserved hypothetical protein [Albugo laibachii Nc14]
MVKVCAQNSTKYKKLQNFLIMKAYNVRHNKLQTFRQQFRAFKKIDFMTQVEYLIVEEICHYLSISPFYRVGLLPIFKSMTILPSSSKELRIDFHLFLQFLQKLAIQATESNQETNLPSVPSRSTQTDTLSEYCDPSQQNQLHTIPPPPVPGVWKKREITIQERITEYTKIDEHGKPQKLIEKEKHQSEIIHMESLNGEFAHREITHFETSEHLNDQLVHHDHGKEEFVHFKSQLDEYSRFESSVPNQENGSGNPQECEQNPPSPTIKRNPSDGLFSSSFASHFQYGNEEGTEAETHGMFYTGL